MHWRPIQRVVPQPRGRCRHRSRLTAASASNIISDVNPINWSRAVDPAGGVELPVMTTDVIVRAAEFWARERRSGIPTSSTDALDADVILAGQAALGSQQGDTVTIATTNVAHLHRFPGNDA